MINSLIVIVYLIYHLSMYNNTVISTITDIDKPANDDRDYRFLNLNNQLDVLLISDSATDKAAAALDVHVGSLSDPDNVAGLAHFLEHLLFMGTEKYPSENEYSSYLSSHGGWSNAFTSGEHTNYYFEVASGDFEGALDRFAQFFISPLFNESCTERELNAVCSEHKKNLQIDAWRFFQLEKSQSAKHHPFRKFGTGNYETLHDIPEANNIDIRKVLLDFHARYYSANIMKLVVLGKDPLDRLQEWVVSKFAGISNKQVQPPVFPSDPYTENELQHLVRVRPVKDLRLFELTFPFPDTQMHYRKKPVGYLSHLLGHEGTGSILSCLKSKGWATGLSSGAAHGARGFDLYKVSIDLTESGLEQFEAVADTVFSYIGMLHRDGLAQQWVFDEVKAVETMHFKFKEKSEPAGFVSWVAGQMAKYPPNHILSGSYVVEEFDHALINQLLQLLTPKNARLVISSPDFEYSEKAGWQKEHIYSTEYLSEPFTKEQVERWTRCLAEPGEEALRFPEKNSFLPTNFATPAENATAVPLKQPRLIANKPDLRLWYKRDDVFFVPRVNVYISVHTPFAYFSPRTAVLTRLFVELVKDALNEYAYPADVAGLSYNLESNQEGLLLTLAGYNDKLALLLTKVLESMRALNVDPERFRVVKEKYTRQLRNFKLEAPYQHAMYYVNLLTQDCLWTHAEKLDAAESIESTHIPHFIEQLLESAHVELLVHGNWDETEAQTAADTVLEKLQVQPLVASAAARGKRTIVLPDNSQFILELDVSNPDNVNSGIEFVLQVGDPADDLLRATLSLFAQIASEPCFDTLRTKEQLGYLVFSNVRRQSGMMSFRILVQSEWDCDWLEWRIESFLFKLGTLISELSDVQFKKHVAALRSRLLERNENLLSESSKYFYQISEHALDFGRRERDAERLLSLTKANVLGFYEKYVKPPGDIYPGGSSTGLLGSVRRKLSVHMVSQHLNNKQSRAQSASSLPSDQTDGIDNDLDLQSSDVYVGHAAIAGASKSGPSKLDLPEPLPISFESTTDWLKAHNVFIASESIPFWKAQFKLSNATVPFRSLSEYQ